MQLNKGMLLDVPKHKAPAGSWTYADNMVIGEGGFPCNEKGTSIHRNLGLNNEPCGIIKLDTGYIVFTVNTVDNKCRIERVNAGGTSTTIINDIRLGFSKTNPIQGRYYFNNAGELVIVWWEGLGANANRPRALNIDCLPFELTVNKEFINDADVDQLELVGKINDLLVIPTVENSGGNLRTGSITLYFAYEFTDGSRTNWFHPTNPIKIVDESMLADVWQIDGGNDLGSNKSIRLQLFNINTSYNKVAVLAVYDSGTSVEAVRLQSFSITGSSYVYSVTSLDNGVPVNLVSELTPTLTFDRIHAGANVGNVLYVGNVKFREKPDIQAYVNNIKVRWSADEQVDIHSKDGFVNPSTILTKRTFKHNEVYALYLILTMDDGNRYAYHIPGRGQLPIDKLEAFNENALVSAIVAATAPDHNTDQILAIDNNARHYQFYDTSRVDGRLGFWENRDEYYPNTDCFLVKDSDDIVVGDLRSLRVRHHKMPTLIKVSNKHTTWLEPFSAMTDYITTSINGWSGNTATFQETINNAGADVNISYANTRYTVEFLTDKYLEVNFFFRLSGGDNDKFSTLEFDTIVNGVVVAENEYRADTKADGVLFYQYFPKGSKLQIRIIRGANENATAGSALVLKDTKINDSIANTRLLSLRLEDVYIPDEIRKNVVSYELGYAARDSENSTVLAQTTLFRLYNKDTTVAEPAPVLLTDDIVKCHPFDMMLDGVSEKPDYIDEQSRWVPVIGTTHPVLHAIPTGSAMVVRSVEEFKYVPHGVTDPIDNEIGEDCVFMRLGAPIGQGGPQPLPFRSGGLYDLKRHKTNIYTNFQNQRVITTGKRFNPTAATANNIMGGDTFAYMFSTIMPRPMFQGEFDEGSGQLWHVNRLQGNYVYEPVFYAAFGVHNVNHRHKDVFGYPPRTLGFAGSILPMKAEEKTQVTNGLDYNKAYSKVNGLTPIEVFYCSNDCGNKEIYTDPYSVFKSVNSANETGEINWRRFLTNDYYRMPHDRGAVWSLQALGNGLVIHQQNSLYFARATDTIATNNVQLALGTGEIFATRPIEILSDESGYFGCRDRFATFVCKYGYVAVDRRGIIGIFDGEKLNEISLVNKNWFEANLPTNLSGDNVYLNSGISAAFDRVENRILISKLGNSSSRFQTFTISYYMGDVYGTQPQWASFHEYAPVILFHNRDAMYAVKDNYVHRHNTGFYGRFYHPIIDITKRMIIDIPVSYDMITEKDYPALTWITKVFDGVGNELQLKTFTNIVTYNDEQCSGEIQLGHNTSILPKNRTVRKIYGKWYFNAFIDRVINPSITTINHNFTININNLNQAKTWFKTSKFTNTFIVVRLIYDNIAGLQDQGVTKIMLTEIEGTNVLPQKFN
jgi:hypothetical protein